MASGLRQKIHFVVVVVALFWGHNQWCWKGISPWFCPKESLLVVFRRLDGMPGVEPRWPTWKASVLLAVLLFQMIHFLCFPEFQVLPLTSSCHCRCHDWEEKWGKVSVDALNTRSQRDNSTAGRVLTCLVCSQSWFHPLHCIWFPDSHQEQSLNTDQEALTLPGVAPNPK